MASANAERSAEMFSRGEMRFCSNQPDYYKSY